MKPDEIVLESEQQDAPRSPKLKLLLSLVATMAVWFVAVDRSVYVEGCYDCGTTWDVFEYRLFGVPLIKSGSESTSYLQVVASDLGQPCSHFRYYRVHRCRYWGMLICAFPCEHGVTGPYLGTPDNYESEIKARVVAIGKEDPSVGKRFEDALVQHDQAYIRCVLQQVGLIESPASGDARKRD